MLKKLLLFFIGIIFFSSCHFAFANLTINEIMYDLSGSDSTNGKSKEWVEIYNPDSSDVSIDASKWRFYDGTANRTINGEANFSIPANGYVVFAGDKDTFLVDHAGFSGTVYDTGITSISNTGDTLKLLDQDGNVIDSVIYASSQGGAGDGYSLQRISGSWAGAIPTPGTSNETTVSPPPPTPSGGGSSSSVYVATVVEKPKIIEIPKIKTQITGKNIGFVNLPLSLQIATFGYSGEKLYYGKYFLNFGDGDSKEIRLGDNSSVTHTYYYPGDYTISLDYYQNYYSEIPDTTAQLNVKIISADVSISRVGDEKDFFIELSNNTDYNADISNWFLVSDYKSFMIPKNSILASKKKMIISPKITGFSSEDKDTLKLMTSQREVVFDYSYPIIATLPKTVVLSKNTTSKIVVASENLPFVTKVNLDESASVINSVASKENTEDPSSSLFIYLISLLFIGACAGVVYFIRQKKTISEAGSEFEILDD